jgi:hypothetical protein
MACALAINALWLRSFLIALVLGCARPWLQALGLPLDRRAVLLSRACGGAHSIPNAQPVLALLFMKCCCENTVSST